MNKIFLLLGCFAASILQTQAQSDSLFTDSTLSYSFETIIDSCFKHVDLEQVPTGILIEKAMATTNVFMFFRYAGFNKMLFVFVTKIALIL